jgi:hypothetical protein
MVISFLIKLYLILLISVQTSDVTGAKILPFVLLPFALGSKQALRNILERKNSLFI